jgi:hypothetical protein
MHFGPKPGASAASILQARAGYKHKITLFEVVSGRSGHRILRIVSFVRDHITTAAMLTFVHLSLA